jgi:hypothetical protein
MGEEVSGLAGGALASVGRLWRWRRRGASRKRLRRRHEIGSTRDLGPVLVASMRNVILR